MGGIILVIQIVSGILLAMHYTPHIDLAFLSLEYFMRQVDFGWLIRYTHANGASMFFGVIYLHIARGIFYSSYAYPRGQLWISGIIIFILMMATGFMGYVLPWGQMSFWGVTVITNFFTAIPFVGTEIVEWLWGGFTIKNPTLNRFFSLHFTMPFIIAGATILHLSLLHRDGSNNPLGGEAGSSVVGFYPYFYAKDLFAFSFFLTIFSCFVMFAPNYLGHADNYIMADPFHTPKHIVPEWYFLPAYAILRSIPNKLLGVLALFGALLVLLVLPFVTTSEVRSSLYRPLHQKFFWLLVADYVLLGYLGQQVPESPFIEIGQVASVYYFAYFLVIIPVLGRLEKSLRLA